MIRGKEEKLYVFYEDVLVGELIRDSELVYSFSYSGEWLSHPERFPLSLAMPLEEGVFGNKVTLSFFENLLPEGETKEALEKGHHIEGPFDFLKEFGADCAGAIIVSAKNKSPFKWEAQSEVKLEMDQIYEAIEEKKSVAEVISEREPGYLSIAGAQDKFAAIYRDGEFYLPLKGKPTTHIVKVPIYRSGVKESVYNEYYCMRLAEKVGLQVPQCSILEGDKNPLFLTERYDRVVDKEGRVKRLHQQDFCQAQGIVSEFKYEEKGGPSLKDNYELIKERVTIKKRSMALFRYLDWVCFNFLIGNNDSHSKNLSFLLKDNKIELAPFYDLMCTAIYPKLKRQFSFKIGDCHEASRIGRKQLEMVDESLGLKKGTMSERMLLMSEKLQQSKDELADEIELEHPHIKIVRRVSDLIEKRSLSLKRQGLSTNL